MSDVKDALIPIEPPPAYESPPGLLPNDNKAPRPLPAPRIPFPLDLPAINFTRGKRVLLASASPRRKQLLAQIGLTNLEIIPSTAPENFPKTLSPFEYVLKTATQKALNVYTSQIDLPDKDDPALILAADTVCVTRAGVILEKPRSEAHHIAMLKGLRNDGLHTCVTAVACMAPLPSARDPGYVLETHVEETTVHFDRAVTDELILAYVKTREGVDKAGGYGIQGVGAVLVDKIVGNFENVVGLPLRATLVLIEKVVGVVEFDEEGGEMESLIDD